MNLQNPFARFFLWAAGVPPETANQVQEAIPNIQALIRLSQEAAPTIKKLEAWYAKAKPLIDQGIPLINEAHPYVKRAIPLVEEAFDDCGTQAPQEGAEYVLAWRQWRLPASICHDGSRVRIFTRSLDSLDAWPKFLDKTIW